MNIHAGYIQRKPDNKKKPFSETLALQGLYSNPSADSLDWKGISASEIVKRVTGKVGGGSIVLFHNAGEHTPEALPTILQTLIADGYDIVPISEILLEGEYTLDHEGRQRSAES